MMYLFHILTFLSYFINFIVSRSSIPSKAEDKIFRPIERNQSSYRSFFIDGRDSSIVSRHYGNHRGSPPLNILLILADDLGFGDTSVIPFVGSGIKTPNLQRMAERGTILTNFHAAAPTCTPTRASLLTGMYPWRLGIKAVFEYGDRDGKSNRDDWLLQVPTAPMLFAENGYQTFHSGKWHLGGMRQDDLRMRLLPNIEPGKPGTKRCPHSGPNQQGFQQYVSVLDGPGSPRQNDLQVQEKLYSEGCQYLLENDQQLRSNSYNISGYLSYCEAQHAMRFMTNSVNDGKPFYLHLWFHAPHGPWQEIPGYEKMYPDERPKNMDEIPACQTENSKYSRFCYHVVAGKKRVNDKGMNRMMKYKTMVSDMDKQIGMVLDHIDQLGIAKDTLIFFTSDNGPEDDAGGPGIFRSRKRHLYEGGIRVPAIAQWIGTIPAGGVVNALTVSTDLFPTFVDAAGLTLPPQYHLDGISILNDLLSPIPRPLVPAEFTAFKAAIDATSNSFSLHLLNISLTQGKQDIHPFLYAPLEIRDKYRTKRRPQRRHLMQERLIMWHTDFESPRKTAGIVYGYKFYINEFNIPVEVYDMVVDPKEELNLLPEDAKYWKMFTEKFPQYPKSASLSKLQSLSKDAMYSDRKNPMKIYYLMIKIYPALKGFADHGADGYKSYLTTYPALRYTPTPGSAERPIITNIYKKISRDKMPEYIQNFLQKGFCPIEYACNCSIPTASQIVSLPFPDVIPSRLITVTAVPQAFLNGSVIFGFS
jgi:arylsulfatase A